MASALQSSQVAQCARVQTSSAGDNCKAIDDGKLNRTDSTGGLHRHQTWTKRSEPVM